MPAFEIARFYVEVTRARCSAAIVTDYDIGEQLLQGIIKYE